jgi:hypothetical protein
MLGAMGRAGMTALVVAAVVAGFSAPLRARFGHSDMPLLEPAEPLVIRRYDPDPAHPWNRLHRALFVRTTPGGREHTHGLDPLLWNRSRFLLEPPAHQRAIDALDEFLATDVQTAASVKRLTLQRDLWAAFDQLAWMPGHLNDDRHEPAAKALRVRLAEGIATLAEPNERVAALPDTYRDAVAAKQFPVAHDATHPDRPFLPPDLLEETGPWVSLGSGVWPPVGRIHAREVSSRAAFLVFIRLPAGRDATLAFLKGVSRKPSPIPPGTQVALVRRALAVDAGGKAVVTPVVESIQLRVYREDGKQDVCELLLDHHRLFAGRPALRAVGPDEPFEFTMFREGVDPLETRGKDPPPVTEVQPDQRVTVLRSCNTCHQSADTRSVMSIGIRQSELRDGEQFFPMNMRLTTELNNAPGLKHRQYDWGLLQGYLEARAAREKQRHERN